MRILGLAAMPISFSACTATPMFPPAVMKDVEANTFEVKAWEEEPITRPASPSSLTRWSWPVRSYESFRNLLAWSFWLKRGLSRGIP